MLSKLVWAGAIGASVKGAGFSGWSALAGTLGAFAAASILNPNLWGSREQSAHQAWLDQVKEDPIDMETRLVDAHHHMCGLICN